MMTEIQTIEGGQKRCLLTRRNPRKKDSYIFNRNMFCRGHYDSHNTQNGHATQSPSSHPTPHPQQKSFYLKIFVNQFCQFNFLHIFATKCAYQIFDACVINCSGQLALLLVNTTLFYYGTLQILYSECLDQDVGCQDPE